MDAPRHRRRGKLLACFRPAFDTDDGDGDEPVFFSSSLQPSGDEAARRNKRRLRRSFSAALKSVIFNSPLLKKSRSENHQEKGLGGNHYGKDLDGLRSNILSRGKNFVKSVKKNVSRKQRLDNTHQAFWSHNSNPSPLFSSNSSSPPSTSSSSSSSQQSSPARSEIDTIRRAVSLDHHLKKIKPPKNKMKKDRGRKSCAYVIPTLEVCVLMMCLFALIWGKAYAVVTCTSAWLFFAPSRRSPNRRRAEVLNSEEYKKRVIMDGWLERDRTRVMQY